MALSDLEAAVAARPKTRKGPPCTVCELLETLPEAEAAALLRLLKNPTVRYTTLEAELREQQVEVSHYTLSRHTRGLCDARTKLR